MDSTTWLNHMKRWLKSVLFSLPIVSPVFCVALAHFFHTAPHLFAMEGSSHKWTFVFAKHQLRVSANIYKPTSNRETGVGSPHVSASNTGDRMMTDVSESGLSLLQYLPMSYGDQCHMKEAQLGFKLKGRAQDLKGGGLPLWQVACRPLFLHKPNISKPLHMHVGHVPSWSTAGLMDTKPGTCDGG